MLALYAVRDASALRILLLAACAVSLKPGRRGSGQGAREVQRCVRIRPQLLRW